MEEKFTSLNLTLDECKEKHLCPVCGKECPKHCRSTKKNPKWRLFCSDECKYSPKGQEISNQLQKESLQKKYPDHKEYVRITNEKRENTNMKKFGVKNPFCAKEKMEKGNQTKMKKYGTIHPTQTEEVKEKTCQTNLRKRGVENVMYCKEIVDKIILSNRKSHYNYFLSRLKNKGLEPLFDYDTYLSIKEGDIVKFKCLRCGEEFDYIVKGNMLEIKKIRCLNPIHNSSSQYEQELYDWFTSIGIKNIERNKRNWGTDKIYEADFYFPDYKLAVEFNGLYWHSNLNHDNDYHYNKWKFFKDMNIDCIQIFENEWRDNKEIVKGIILNRLGKSNKIFARQCEIKEIPNNEYRLFLEQNHLQGYCAAKIKLGLYYNDKLVMCMSFSKPRFNKKYDWENIRTCSKVGYGIIGGFSKLLSHFKKEYNGTVVSYVDSRYFNGKGYIENGFECINHSSPNYFYFTNKENILFNRVEFQKHKLKNKLKVYDENLTEKDNMSANGYLWIYDCGNDVMELNILS